METETRASKCARLAQEFFDKQRAEEIMQKCDIVSKEKGHRTMILAEKDNTDFIVNILKENGFVIKQKNDANGITTYINW